MMIARVFERMPRAALLLIAGLFLFPALINAAETPDIPPMINQIVELNERGVYPQELEVLQKGSLVFFYNGTKDSLASLEISYGEKRAFCSTGRMAMGKDGVVRSISPFSPGGFVTVCFSDPGEYPVTFYGLERYPAGLKAKVVVR